jgi:hypothetical protein
MPIKYTKNEEGHFVCPHCNVTKEKQNTMHYHIRKHEEQVSHTCKVCKKGFLQKQTLDLHMKSRHADYLKAQGNEAAKVCCPFEDCNFSALTKGNCIIHCLRVHFKDEVNKIMNIDNETKTIICEECDKEFSSSCAFYYHCKGCVPFDEKSNKYKLFQEITA